MFQKFPSNLRLLHVSGAFHVEARYFYLSCSHSAIVLFVTRPELSKLLLLKAIETLERRHYPCIAVSFVKIR